MVIHNILPFAIKLCLLFNGICKKFIDPHKLEKLENEVISILLVGNVFSAFFLYHYSCDISFVK